MIFTLGIGYSVWVATCQVNFFKLLSYFPMNLYHKKLFTQIYTRNLELLLDIVISKLLKRHSKAKRRAPAYSRALRQIRGVSNSPWEAQVRLPEGERMRQIDIG